MGEPLNK